MFGLLLPSCFTPSLVALFPSFLPAYSPALLPACKPACPATTLGRALPGSLGIIDPGEGVACRTQPYHTTPHHATPSPSCTFCSCCSCYCWGGISLDLHLHLPSCSTHCAMSFCCRLSHLILSSCPHSILPHRRTTPSSSCCCCRADLLYGIHTCIPPPAPSTLLICIYLDSRCFVLP